MAGNTVVQDVHQDGLIPRRKRKMADDQKHAFVGDGETCGKDGCSDKKGAASHFAEVPEEIAKALGFKADERPSVASALDVIKGIQTENTAKFAEGDPALKAKVKELEHNQLVTKYAEVANSLTLVEGKPEDIRDELVAFHEKFGEEAADELVDAKKAVQAAAEIGGETILKDKAPAAIRRP